MFSFTFGSLRSTVASLCMLLLLVAVPALAQVSNGLVTAPGQSGMRFWVDIDNDGRDDYCAVTGDGWDRMDCYLSTGSGFNPTKRTIVIPSRSQPFWMDFNGDGGIDLCLGVGQPGGTIEVLNFNQTLNATITCRMGPDFTNQANFQIPMSKQQKMVVSGNNFYQQTDGISTWDDLFTADVNGDGRADACYLHSTSATASMSLRCLTSNGAGVDPLAAAWRSIDIQPGQRDWPRQLVDFNGDGFQDFCRVISGGTVRCLLGGPNGFTATEVVSVPVSAPNREGAAFVDVNGDGNVDFCRIAGSGAGTYLSCLMSNGIGWEAVERISPPMNMGDQNMRWWVDINADGLPDFCRAMNSTMACRLSRGDGDGASSYAFGFSDVSTAPLDFGTVDGGRAFCDANGNALQTYCRVTFPQTGTQHLCYWTDEGAEVCYDVPVNNWNLSAGLVAPSTPADTSVQARAPFLTAFSDGVGAEVRVSYLPMTNPAVYVRSGVVDNSPRHAIVQPRSSIVYETRSWRQGTSQPMTGIARYSFSDYRNDLWLGSRGFRERWIFTEASNSLEHIVFYQGLGPSVDSDSIENDRREVGMIKKQERFAVANGSIPSPGTSPGAPSPRTAYIRYIMETARGLVKAPLQPIAAASPFVLLQRSTNTLKDTSPANPRYRFTGTSLVENWDWNAQAGTSVALPTVESSTEMNDVGDVTRMFQKTTAPNGLWWSKTTTNEYDPAKQNPSAWILGRLTRSTVVSQSPSVEQQLAANTTSPGRSPSAAVTSSATPPAQQPLDPAVLSVILQLLLED